MPGLIDVPVSQQYVRLGHNRKGESYGSAREFVKAFGAWHLRYRVKRLVDGKLVAVQESQRLASIRDYPKSATLDLQNFADRVMKPILKAHGLQWHVWHAYRRRLDTNLKQMEVDDLTDPGHSSP